MMASTFDKQNVIMAGDFNITLEKKDKRHDTSTKHSSVKVLKEIMNLNKLIDVWRTKHQQSNMFTWHPKNRSVFCRLDFFLISSNLIDNYKDSRILESIMSDHKIISLELKNKSIENTRGRGFYKFNNSLLQDENYIRTITDFIQNKKREYEIIADKRVAWDLLKFEIQTKTIEISIEKARERRRLEKDMQQKCDTLYKKL